MKLTPYDKAKFIFKFYERKKILVGWNELNIRRIQKDLKQWQNKNFGKQKAYKSVMGMSEEIGELTEALLVLVEANGRINHAILKKSQKIRGMNDKEKHKAAIADAIADILIYTTQLCTALKLDLGTLYHETAKEVMNRDWKKNKKTGTKKAK